MSLNYEIYLVKKHVSKKEWIDLINIISKYNGFFKKWKIIVINNKNRISFFIETNCMLPATINNLDSYLLKPTKKIKVKKETYNLLSFSQLDSNIIELINYNKIKNKGTLKYLEMNFIKISENKILKRINYYLLKNHIIKKYHMFYGIPETILSVDFEVNKSYFYKTTPKYLDINKVIHLLNTDTTNALLLVDTFPYLQGDFYLNQNNFSFDKHSIIVGGSGSGKSKFISKLITNISKNSNLKQKYKVVVIDPHASLENDIGGIGKVIDFKSEEDSLDLFINSSSDIISSTELLLDLLKNLIADQYNSKLERVLRHSIHLLLKDESFNFRNLRRLILDLEYRNNLIKKLKYELPITVIDFFLSDYNDLKTKSYTEAISPIISFIDEMEMIPVFNEEKNYSNLKDTINNNFLTIFSLDRTLLGNKVTKTISGLIMQQLLTMVEKRNMDKHIIFVIDEVAVIENPILTRFLSEARKYNLSLILIGQYFNQISSSLQTSIFANVVNYFIFRVSKLDANVLVDNFNMKVPLDDTRERKIKILTELQTRECVVRIDNNGMILPAFKGYTLEHISIPRKKVKRKEININIEEKDVSKDFKINPKVSLKDILLTNSTSRKDVLKNE